MMKSLGQRIKKIRAGESRDIFGDRYGVHRNTLGRWENGERSPSVPFLISLVRDYHVEPEWLLMGTGPMHSSPKVVQLHAPATEGKKDCLTVQDLELELKEERSQLRMLIQQLSELTGENRKLWQENASLRVELAESRPRRV